MCWFKMYKVQKVTILCFAAHLSHLAVAGIHSSCHFNHAVEAVFDTPHVHYGFFDLLPTGKPPILEWLLLKQLKWRPWSCHDFAESSKIWTQQCFELTVFSDCKCQLVWLIASKRVALTNTDRLWMVFLWWAIEYSSLSVIILSSNKVFWHLSLCRCVGPINSTFPMLRKSRVALLG